MLGDRFRGFICVVLAVQTLPLRGLGTPVLILSACSFCGGRSFLLLFCVRLRTAALFIQRVFVLPLLLCLGRLRVSCRQRLQSGAGFLRLKWVLLFLVMWRFVFAVNNGRKSFMLKVMPVVAGLLVVAGLFFLMLSVSGCQVKVDQSDQIDDGNIRGRR